MNRLIIITASSEQKQTPSLGMRCIRISYDVFISIKIFINGDQLSCRNYHSRFGEFDADNENFLRKQILSDIRSGPVSHDIYSPSLAKKIANELGGPATFKSDDDITTIQIEDPQKILEWLTETTAQQQLLKILS